MARLESRHWWFLGTRALALALLRKYAPGSGRLLDLGCGTGLTLSMLPSAYEAFGLDASADALRFASRMGDFDHRPSTTLLRPGFVGQVDHRPWTIGHRDSPLRPLLVRSDAAAIPFADRTFDAVTALDVLEHIHNHAAAAAEIRRVLKLDGVLIASVPAHQWMFSTHDKALGHQRRYARRELRALLSAAGFEILKLTYANCALFPAIAAYRLLRKAFARSGTAPGSDLSLPPAPINAALRALLKAEAAVAALAPLPFGVSLFVVARLGPLGAG